MSDIEAARKWAAENYMTESDILLAAYSARKAERWYLGSMNDAVFIINTPPRPSNDFPVHDRKDGPTLVLRTHPLTKAEREAIVDAHNATVA